jgi:hypothetical protein
MNVIVVRGNYRNRKRPNDLRPNMCRLGGACDHCEDQWHSRLEVLLFALIATVSAWPLFYAGEAVFRYL